MGITLEILSWRATGFRCPDHHVDFTKPDGTVYPVTLLQMPNGTGKTTTLALLRAALSGTATVLGDDTALKGFQALGSDSDQAVFELRLRYWTDATVPKLLTVKLLFDFSIPEVRFQTTIGSGMENSFRVPPELRPFLNEKFVNFFVFDGELAERLLSRAAQDARQVVDRLFELENLETMRARVFEHWQEQARKSGAADKKGLTQRRNKVTELESREKALKEQKDKCDSELSEVSRLLAVQRQKFAEALAQKDKSHGALEDIQNRLSISLSDVARLNADYLRVARNPATMSAIFAKQVMELKSNLDRAKLPESTAREFFEEIAQEDECICGRPLDDATRVSLLARSKLYLGSEDTGLLNAMKENIATAVGADVETGAKVLSAIAASLTSAMRVAQELQTEKDSIAADRIANDPELDKAKKDIDALEQRERELEAIQERFASTDDQSNDKDTYGISVIGARLKLARIKLAEITETIETKKRSDVLRSILETARRNANQRISAELIERTNERIGVLLPDNRLRVEKINNNLVLKGQEGGSVGETLSVAYAFLSTLFNNTNQLLPFVVDSPAGSIDLAVRARVADMIPNLTRQFVAFIISSERGGFVQPLSTLR